MGYAHTNRGRGTPSPPMYSPSPMECIFSRNCTTSDRSTENPVRASFRCKRFTGVIRRSSQEARIVKNSRAFGDEP